MNLGYPFGQRDRNVPSCVDARVRANLGVHMTSDAQAGAAADGAVAADTAVTAETADAGTAAPAEDELKRKFREALERKRGRQADGNSGDDAQAGGRIHGTHGPAASKRAFRRKSGG